MNETMVRRAQSLSGKSVEVPYTGQEFLNSIADDGREVWLRGERIKDVTKHLAFRNSARMVARFYDAMHDERHAATLRISLYGGEGWTHPAYQAPKTLEDHLLTRDSIAAGARLTYGWMGRSPDFVGTYFSAGFHVNADLFGEYRNNALALYDRMRRKAPHFGHALVNPPIDRHMIDQPSDLNVVVEKETDAGLIVSGAKVVATGSVLCQEVIIAHNVITSKDRRNSPVFVIPLNTPGVKLVCRRSYEEDAAKTASPFDFPISSRLDENDAILIFEKVLVPWEKVLVYRDDPATLMQMPGIGARMLMHGCIRLAVKMDFICGLFIKAVEIGGTKDFRGVQMGVGEAIGFRNALWAFVEAMARDPAPWGDGFIRPQDGHAQGFRALAGERYSMVRKNILAHVASGLIYMPSDAADFKNPEVRSLLDKYARGSHGNDAERRAKVLKLLWDAVGSEFGARHELYELNYSGSQEQVRVDQYIRNMRNGTGEGLVAFAETCMAEYDLNGWVAPDLVNPLNR